MESRLLSTFIGNIWKANSVDRFDYQTGTKTHYPFFIYKIQTTILSKDL